MEGVGDGGREGGEGRGGTHDKYIEVVREASIVESRFETPQVSYERHTDT